MADDPTPVPATPGANTPDGDPARLTRAADIFFAVKGLDLVQREDAVDRACGEDAELRRLVWLLLRGADAPLPVESLADEIRVAAQQAGASSVGVTAAPGEGESGPTRLVWRGAPTDQRGDRIGNYRLLERLGEGGFGVVFAAEQTEPVKRMVALKVLKLGMDTRQIVARFEAERQALALMDHPNIARVFDAGATPSGRPYFAMELVKGDPITTFCDREKLTIQQRLGLFATVCEAVQHAHAKGVIHRDIKPSNVLVAMVEGKPVAKVIDFGIAKAIDRPLTEKTLFTEHKQLIGTPEYMSPEQAEGTRDIDTRTDVYALGVLLYELLTGLTPFDGKRLRSAGFGEMQRIIREIDPPRPSTRLSTAGDGTSAAAASRRTEPVRLATMIRRELDWVVMKALEKDRSRRYDSASNLAADIRRYLGGDAVLAVPPSAGYRFQKFVRRNKGPVVAGALLVLALFTGLVGTSLGFFRAESQRKIAVSEKSRAEMERERADENAGKARAAEALATRSAYTANMMSASAAIQDVQYATARVFLDAAPERLRGWEWRVLDAKIDSSVRTCSTTAKPRNAVGCDLILHPDGQSFFTIDHLGDTLAQRWDLASGRLLQSFPVPDPTKALRHNRVFLSPDGRRLTTTPAYRAAGSTSFMIDSWDLSSGERTTRVEVACPNGSHVRTIVSRDGSRVYVYDSERAWSTRVAPGEAHGGAAITAPSAILAERPLTQLTYPQAVNHADTVIAESVDSPPYGLVLSDAASLAPITVIAWRTLVQNVRFSHDDRWLGVTGNDETARVYDLAANPPTFVELKHPYLANNIRFSPDASLVATIANDRAIRVWDRATGRLLSTYSSETLDPWPLMFMPDGKTVAGWESDGTIRFWDVTAENAAVLGGHKSIVASAKFAAGNPAGIIVSSSWEGADGSTGIVRFWDAESGDEVGIYRGQPGDIAFGMDVSDDGRFAAIAIMNHPARLQSLGGAIDQPTGRTEIIDLTTGERVSTSPSRRSPWRVGFGRDHQSVIVSEFDNNSHVSFQLHLIDARSGAVVRTKELDPKCEWVLARSPDGKTLAALPSARNLMGFKSDRPGTMLILDTQSLGTVREIDGIPEGQRSLAFSPDGTRIATGGEDGIIRLFAADTGKPLGTTSEQGMGVLTMSFSPDGTRLASAGLDRMVRIWDAASLDSLAAFSGHGGHIGSVNWDAEGHRLVSCSGDFTVRVWEPDPIRTRLEARDTRRRTIAQVEPMVLRLFGELNDGAQVVARVHADPSLTPLQRKYALQAVLSHSLAHAQQAK